MGTSERRARESALRRELVTRTARAIAEREGWAAVTTRRLAAEIEYGQPVIYRHFASLEDLSETVALDGFAELAETLRAARLAAPDEGVVAAVAEAYTAFADRNTAVYEAMFTMKTRLPFATDVTPPQLSAAYAELRAAIVTISGDRDPDTLSEVFWAALHGLVTLGRNRRLRPDLEAARLTSLVDAFLVLEGVH